MASAAGSTSSDDNNAHSADPASTSPSNGNGNGHSAAAHGKFWGLALGSAGVVYGDIGTSPLYAFREALHPAMENGLDRAEILGVVSLALWALIIVVTVKYVLFLMRADNKGEGGVLALMALAQRAMGRRVPFIFIAGMAGAALFYGDAILTPAISVLSAVEGLKTIPALSGYVTPGIVLGITVVILIGLFAVQARGTGKVAAYFGPIMVLWFVVLAGLGLYHIGDDPGVLLALNPYYAGLFLAQHGLVGFVVLGAVFLCVTGAEALYADMGHFGRWPIQATWMFFVLPALALNYLGQGALVLANPEAAKNPFFLLAPEFLRAPLVVLATVATIIASQAVITGAFSLTQQAIQLGLLPRMEIRRTSETQTGQIYIGRINGLLLLGVLFLVATFQTSTALASAYGIAVTATMMVDTLLAFFILWKMWKWNPGLAVLFLIPFLIIDMAFLGANLLKVVHGGWVPLVLAFGLILTMATWLKGTGILSEKTRRDSIKLTDLLTSLEARPPHKVPGTAIFLTSDPDLAPVAMMHNLKHNKVLHEKIAILTVRTAESPRVAEADRLEIEDFNDHVKKIIVNYGFMETPNIPKALSLSRKKGFKFDIMATSFFLGHRTIVPSAHSGMPLWQDKIFIFLARNAANATDFFHIPSGRVVELGTQVTV